MNISSIFIPVLVGLICGILGYLFGKMNSKQHDSLASALQADLDACKANVKNLKARISFLEAELEKSESITKNQRFTDAVRPEVNLFDAELAATVYGKTIIKNDLKIVEGIGSKIESLLHNAGISTWQNLSEASTEEIQDILDEGGENYAIHNPSTWSKQALLAYEGKWQELKDLQEEMLGGVE